MKIVFMKKRFFLLMLMALLTVIPAHAVLKERDLSKTLAILRNELTQYHLDLEEQSVQLQEQQDKVRRDLFKVLKQANQNSLMLYSQKAGYTFDLTYACHEATEQYHTFQKDIKPFRTYIDKAETEIARYDSLILNLSTMPVMILDDKQKTDRNVCLALAVNIRRQLAENQQTQKDYVKYYQATEQRLKSLNDYANLRYGEIQTSIFRNGGESYPLILSQLKSNVEETTNTIEEKYRVDNHVVSDWDSRMIIGLFIIIAIFGGISFFLNFIIFRWLMTKFMNSGKVEQRLKKRVNMEKRRKSFMEKRTCINLAMMVVTFAIILGGVRATVNQNFIIMASKLLIQFAWLMGVILISLLLRVSGSQIKSAFRIYSPLMVMGFIVIAFRIIFIPNDLVNLIFPPILLACAVWQWWEIRKHAAAVPKSDSFYAYISLMVFIVSVVCSWIGYTLLSVQILIWWIMQLTCILTITCLSSYLNDYAKKHDYEHKPITKTWFYNFCHKVVLPVAAVMSVLLSIYWAADVFNLSDTTRRIFYTRFIDTKNFSVSILTLAMVVNLYFLFSYIYKTLKKLLEEHFKDEEREHRDKSASSRSVMVTKLLQIVIWGLWLIISLGILHVGNTWLMVVSGGLSTGVGFASKDILENIYYGISLMAGRIKIGDYIECDGTRGKVKSISYTSTTIETLYGSIITFQNSQLFSKNFRNLTLNHGYELNILEVGVAYGTDIDKCKQLLIEAISKLDILQYGKKPVIRLKEFGDNSIVLNILIWVPVEKYSAADAEVMECVYNVLNENNIAIPFPQRDLHIIHDVENMANKEVKA